MANGIYNPNNINYGALVNAAINQVNERAKREAGYVGDMGKAINEGIQGVLRSFQDDDDKYDELLKKLQEAKRRRALLNYQEGV